MGAIFDEAREEHIPALSAPLEGRLVPSPYNFEFTGEDALRLTVHNSQSGAVVAVHYRLKPPKGETIANTYTLTPTSDRVATTSEFVIGRGYLLNVTLFASSGSPRRGQTFARLQVIRGRSAAATVLGTIVQGYVTGNQDRAWPGSPLEGSLEGDGYVRSINGTDPAADNDILETVPTGARWHLLTLLATLTTSAVAGARRPLLNILNGSTVAVRSSHAHTIDASTATGFGWMVGMPLTTVISTIAPGAGIPTELRLLAAQTIVVNHEGAKAGDNWAAPNYSVMEWLEAA